MDNFLLLPPYLYITSLRIIQFKSNRLSQPELAILLFWAFYRDFILYIAIQTTLYSIYKNEQAQLNRGCNILQFCCFWVFRGSIFSIFDIRHKETNCKLRTEWCKSFMPANQTFFLEMENFCYSELTFLDIFIKRFVIRHRWTSFRDDNIFQGISISFSYKLNVCLKIWYEKELK